MAPPSKSKKAKAKATASAIDYQVLSKMDGNPQTPKEFDESPHDDDELFFEVEKDADEKTKTLILLLNFVHLELHQATERKVPVLEHGDDEKFLEVYHRAVFRGVGIDVCVYFEDRNQEGNKSCFALVKRTADDINDETTVVVSSNATTNAATKADKFSKKQGLMNHNYWAPRWKYVVNILRDHVYNRFEKNGEDIPELEPQVVDEEIDSLTLSEPKEEEFLVFAGATGKIIGPKGTVINEIRASSGCKDIKMPERSDEKPKARALVPIKLNGTARQIEKAKASIQVIVDEWANAPRPPRNDYNSGGSGGDGFGGGGFGNGGGFENNFAVGGDNGGGFTDGPADWEQTGGETADWEQARGGVAAISAGEQW